MKSYTVQIDDEYTKIIFASDRNEAKFRAANMCNIDYKDVTSDHLKRAKQFDEYSEQGFVPPKILIEKHGWRWECHQCLKWITEAPVATDEKGNVFCSEKCKLDNGLCTINPNN